MNKSRGLKLGVIGAGSMGKNHARIASTLAGVTLAGVADSNLAAAQEAVKYLRVPAYEDYRQLLPEIDAACIVTPTQTHYQIALDCIRAGKHLLIEKPFTGQSKLAKEIVSLAQAKNVILAVGLIERFNPAFSRLTKALKGEKIIGVDIKRFSPFPERVTDANVIFDMMLHDLDLLKTLLPCEIGELKAKGEKLRTATYDRVVATLTYANGIIARLDANRVFSVKTRKISVTTANLVIDADLLNKTVYVRDFTSPTPSALPVKPIDQLTEELNNFISAIKGKKEITVSGAAALGAIALAEEIEKAC